MGIEDAQLHNVEWDNKVNDILGRLDALPKTPGPVFEVVAKGKKFKAETVFIEPLKLMEAGGYGKFLKGNLADVTYYMFIKDEGGEIIATRISSLDMAARKKIVVNSAIEVRDKGKGVATPVDSMFMSLLQYLADEYKQPIEWRIQNENIRKLYEYEDRPDADPIKLEEMRQEQQRWQALYGPEGKFEIKDHKKTFHPQDTETLTRISARTNLNVSRIFSS